MNPVVEGQFAEVPRKRAAPSERPTIPQGPHWDEDKACFVAEPFNSVNGWRWVPRNAKAMAKVSPDKPLSANFPPMAKVEVQGPSEARALSPAMLARHSDIENLARKMCMAENPDISPNEHFVAGMPLRVRDGYIPKVGVPLWTVYVGMATLAYDFEKTVVEPANHHEQ
jgi:hypothetical protein